MHITENERPKKTVAHLPSLSITLHDVLLNEVSDRVQKLLHLNLDNPTSHYRLELENPADAAIAERSFIVCLASKISLCSVDL